MFINCTIYYKLYFQYLSLTDTRFKIQDHCFAFLQNNILRNKKFIAEMFISSASAHNIENKAT